MLRRALVIFDITSGDGAERVVYARKGDTIWVDWTPEEISYPAYRDPKRLDRIKTIVLGSSLKMDDIDIPDELVVVMIGNKLHLMSRPLQPPFEPFVVATYRRSNG